MKREKVSSTNIESIGYNPASSILEVEFILGDVYRYFDVPERLYLGLISASSHGEFLSDYIKNHYRYQKVN